MLKLFYPLFVLLIGAGGAIAGQNEMIDVVSYNIRFDNPRDGVNVWSGRIDEVAQIAARADIAGLQEALHNQIIDLQERLEGFSWFGLGRDDGELAGEFSPVFYRSDRFELLDEGTFWLSQTPDEPGSRDWDAAITRICTWGKLRDKTGGREFFIFNTHFDHRGRQARLESARLVCAKIRQIAQGKPVIFAGDLNTVENSEPYNVIVGRIEVDGRACSLGDTRYLTGRAYDGPSGTSTRENWTKPSLHGPIDYIFVDSAFEVHEYAVWTDRRDDGHFPSDHLPVYARIRLRD